MMKMKKKGYLKRTRDQVVRLCQKIPKLKMKVKNIDRESRLPNTLRKGLVQDLTDALGPDRTDGDKNIHEAQTSVGVKRVECHHRPPENAAIDTEAALPVRVDERLILR